MIRENWELAIKTWVSFSASIPWLIAMMAEIFWFPLMQDLLIRHSWSQGSQLWDDDQVIWTLCHLLPPCCINQRSAIQQWCQAPLLSPALAPDCILAAVSMSLLSRHLLVAAVGVGLQGSDIGMRYKSQTQFGHWSFFELDFINVQRHQIDCTGHKYCLKYPSWWW